MLPEALPLQLRRNQADAAEHRVDMPKCRKAREDEVNLATQSLLHPTRIEEWVRSGRLPATVACCLLLQTGHACSVSEVADRFGVKKTGLYKYLRAMKEAGLDLTCRSSTQGPSELVVHSEGKGHSAD